MATIMSTGQITLVDLTDQRTSSFYLQADKSKIQIANVNGDSTTYSPDFSNNDPLIITPSFFFGNEKIELTNANITYYINETAVTTEVNSDAADPSDNKFFVKGSKLYIKQNIPSFGDSVTQLRIRAVVAAGLMDNETGLATAADIEATIEFALVESGKNGTSISKIETYYKTTTQYSVPSISDSDWDQDASKFTLSATNKYLWAYQKTYYVNNVGEETSENGNVFLAGTYGDTGATGKDGTSVDSITEQYYVSTSETSPTGGSWSNSAPTTLTTDKYLWTRTKIVYKYADGTTSEPVYQPTATGKCDYTWNLAVKEVANTMAAINTLQGSYEALQNQVDGAIDTWYGTEAPTITSYPTNEWKTDADKIRHNGDLYYDTDDGKAYKYQVVTSNGAVTSHKWEETTDDALAAALKEIQDIGAEVDGKMTIYYNEPNSYPTTAALGDLWIQGVDGDQYKCIKAYDTTIAINSNNWTTYWGLANQSIGSVDIQFCKNASATDAPDSNADWTTDSPAWEQGKYIWQRTVTYDRSGNILTESDPVCITSASRSITQVINYYLATNLNTGVTTENASWTTDVDKAALTKDTPYLWNYEKVVYTYGDPDISDPTIIGNFAKDGNDGDDGRGIVSITEYYLINNSKDTPTFTIGTNGQPTSTSWLTTIPTPTDDNPYLWNAEVIEYTSETNKYEAKAPALIGYRGVGVKEAKVYYKRNNNKDSAPAIDSSWSTSFVDVDINNKFLWSYTKTTFTNNTSSNSTPVIIAKYVEDGADAVFGLVEAEGKTIFSDQDSSAIKLTARFMVGGSEVPLEAANYVWTAIGSSKTGTGQTLSVDRDYVTNVATFICTMTHSEYGTVTDRITLQDKTDPIWCEVISSKGDKFTNGNTSTVLTAVIYGSVKGKYTNDEMKQYYFNWKKYDKNGDLVTTFTPTYASEIGKGGCYNAISLNNNAVDTRAIFTVEVTKENQST